MKLLLLATLGIFSCATNQMPYVEQVVQNQASFDFDCDQSEIKISPLGRNRYLASGCLQREVYVCNDGWFTMKKNVECTQKPGGQE